MNDVANVYPIFKKEINVAYPPGNKPIFEEWFDAVYVGCGTDRTYLPVFWTSYYVNNNYGNDKESITRLHFFLSELDKSKKYFTIVQYDDGTMIDWSMFGLDVLEFNMSKKIGVQIPLLCQAHPYRFTTGKKWLASFVGSRTHPIRNQLNSLIGKDEYYISFEPHDIENYCRILHESVFAICPRGYGASSFRLSEALQYGAIPIYLSDEYILPFSHDGSLPGWWLLANEDSFKSVVKETECFEARIIIAMQDICRDAYEKYYTFDGCFNQIIKTIETEYNSRQQIREDITALS